MHLSKRSSKRCIVFFTYFFTKTKEWKLEKWKLTQLNASRCFEIATRATNENLSISRSQFAPKVACKATIPLKSEHHNLPSQTSRLIDLTTLLRFLKSAALNIYLRLLLFLFEWVEFFGIFCRDREQGYERQRFGGHVMVPPPSLWKFHLSLQSAPWDKRYGQQQSTDVRFNNISVDVSWVNQSSDSLVRVTGIPSNDRLRPVSNVELYMCRI